MKFELTDEQLRNLQIMLDRVPLTGKKEAIAMVSILGALSSPIIDNNKKDG